MVTNNRKVEGTLKTLFVIIVRAIDDWIKRISQYLLLLSGILILLMALAQTYGVIMRYIFKTPDPGAYELSMLFLLFCGVLAVAGVEKLDQHVKNDLVSSHFPPRMKLIVIETIFPFLSLIFCAVLTWKSLDNALYALKIGQVTQSPWALPLAPIKLIIPFGFTLLCLILLSRVINGITRLKNGDSREEDMSA